MSIHASPDDAPAVPSAERKLATLAELARQARDEYDARREALAAARAVHHAAEAAARSANAECRGLLAALEATLARLPHEPDQPPVLPFALPFAWDEVAHYQVGSHDEFPTVRRVLWQQRVRAGQTEAA